MFRCDRDDLIRLGRVQDPNLDERAALMSGANQFKANPDQLREEWRKSAWVKEFPEGQNYLVYARDGGNKDRMPSAGLCIRTRPIAEATSDLKQLLGRFRCET